MNIFNKVKRSVTFRTSYFLKHFGRRKRIHNTVGKQLAIAEIDSLELLEICAEENISIIYDIGANIGIWARLAKAVLPGARIECFEPLSMHFDEFYKNTNSLHNVNLHKIALGSIKGNSIIHITSRSDSSSLLLPSDKQIKAFGTPKISEQKIEVMRLDDYVKENKIPPPDLMKLDVQGFELEVLKGSMNCLSKCRFAILEVSFVEYYKDQPLFEEILIYMSKHNFRLVALGYNTPTGKYLSQTDVLFWNDRMI